MEPTFHHRLINGHYEDPCLYLRMTRERRAMLFDIGSIDRLDQRDLMKISDVFVTHMHIDHFIGFDTLLRAQLRKKGALRLFGPRDIISCVEGKLRGYTWNLIEEYPLRIEVFEVTENLMSRASFYAENSFKRIDRRQEAFRGCLLKETLFTVNAVVLSHGIPCLAFAIEEEYHINIDKAALTAMGLPVGPWLSDFKRVIREDVKDDIRISAGGKMFSLKELRHLAMITEGQKISYVSDVSPLPENIEKTVSLVNGSQVLYCETYFRHEDMVRAARCHHLTAKIAGRIAREGNVKNLRVMHFSPRYLKDQSALEAEAMEEFQRRIS